MKKNLPVTGKEVVLDEKCTIISTKDIKGRITYANQEFTTICGFNEHELLGQSHNIMRHPDMPPEAFHNMWDTIQQGTPWRGIVKNRCKNGDHYWVDAFVTPVMDSNDQIVRYQSVRSRPTRQQIADAESLYGKLNRKEITSIPNKLKFGDISLMKRMMLVRLIISLLPVAGISLWANDIITAWSLAVLSLFTPIILIISLWLIHKTLVQPIRHIVY